MLADSVAAIERCRAAANDRERAHAAAARAWLEGDFARSVRLYGDILLDHPRDLLALQTAHIGDFLLGAVADAARPGGPGAAALERRTSPATATCWACTPSAWRRRTSTTGPRRPGARALELDRARPLERCTP